MSTFNQRHWVKNKGVFHGTGSGVAREAAMRAQALERRAARAEMYSEALMNDFPEPLYQAPVYSAPIAYNNKPNVAVNNPVNQDIRTLDVSVDQPGINNMDMNSIGEFRLINGTINGTGLSNRAGSAITMKSIRVSGGIVRSGETSITGGIDYLRVMVIYDRQPTGSFPSLSTVLADVDWNGVLSTSSMSGINPNNMRRFTTFMDLRLNVVDDNTLISTNLSSSVASGNHDSEMYNFDRFIKLKGAETIYNQTNSNTIGGITTGALYLLAIGNNDTPGDVYELQFKTRLRFNP